jgi:hypothetical protein
LREQVAEYKNRLENEVKVVVTPQEKEIKQPKEVVVKIEETKEETLVEQILMNERIGSLIINLVDLKTLLKLMLLNKQVNTYLNTWNMLSRLIITKIVSIYAQRTKVIQDEYNKQQKKEEMLKKEFDSDTDTLRVYNTYIKNTSSYTVQSYASKALRNSRLFYLSREVYATKVETKGFLDNILSLGKKPSPAFIEVDNKLKDNELAKLLSLEKIGSLEILFKGLQQSVELRVDDQNEVNKWFYNLQLCFCENYIALANIIPSFIVSPHIDHIGFTQSSKDALWEV